MPAGLAGARREATTGARTVCGKKTPIFNDIKEAYRNTSEDPPYYFSDEDPFSGCLGTLFSRGIM